MSSITVRADGLVDLARHRAHLVPVVGDDHIRCWAYGMSHAAWIAADPSDFRDAWLALVTAVEVRDDADRFSEPNREQACRQADAYVGRAVWQLLHLPGEEPCPACAMTAADLTGVDAGIYVGDDDIARCVRHHADHWRGEAPAPDGAIPAGPGITVGTAPPPAPVSAPAVASTPVAVPDGMEDLAERIHALAPTAAGVER